MRFFIYDKSSVSYKRFKFLRRKFLIPFVIIQLIITLSTLYVLTNYYNTPKEKKYKNEISYLLNQFDEVNKRIIESEAILDHIRENDSIIYQSIFDVPDVSGRRLDVYFDQDSIGEYSKIVKETNQRISLLNDDLDYEAYKLSNILNEAYNHQDMLIHVPAIQPIDNDDLKRTASGWGFRIHPIYKIRKFHYGIDFTAKTGTPIYSTGKGTIQYVIPESNKASKGYGNLIIINHGYGYRTLYAHMDKFKVKVGDEVERGDVIGFVGNTGLSTGPHLHYEVIQNGRKVNPINYFFNDLTPEEYHRIVEISTNIKKSYD